jgi:hypothetical protein
MNRRGFLGLLGAFAASAVLDPEKLLWEPGKKLISIPAPSQIIMSPADYQALFADVLDRFYYGIYADSNVMSRRSSVWQSGAFVKLRSQVRSLSVAP